MNLFKTNEIEKAKGEARDLWQIEEKDGELWVTYNNAPVIPESLLKKPALETLLEVRELYVKSKNNLNDAET